VSDERGAKKPLLLQRSAFIVLSSLAAALLDELFEHPANWGNSMFWGLKQGAQEGSQYRLYSGSGFQDED